MGDRRAAKPRPVCIGPVIAGKGGGSHYYYVDVAYMDGTTARMTWPKAAPGADRQAKLAAIRARIGMAKELRPEVILAHDQDSFRGAVNVLARFKDRRQPAALLAG